MASKGITAADLRREAASNDWTDAEWLAGKKSNFEVRLFRHRRRSLALLTS
jgi:hypothetical protein